MKMTKEELQKNVHDLSRLLHCLRVVDYCTKDGKSFEDIDKDIVDHFGKIVVEIKDVFIRIEKKIYNNVES